MASKRAPIGELVSADMAARSLPRKDDAEVQETPARPTRDPQETHNGGTTEVQETPRMAPVKVRFDNGDYEALQDIARRTGTTAAALVRKAVKELIRRG